MTLLVRFDSNANDITLAVNRLDDLRSARVVPQDLAQATYPHIDTAVERISFPTAQQLGQLGTREHTIC